MSMGYNRVGIRSYYCHGSICTKGFRVNPRRFSVQRLRTKFAYLFRVFNRWKTSYGQALWSMLRKGHVSISRSKNSRKRMIAMERQPIMSKGDQYSSSRFRSFGRSNSFYSEAIADCLEFIKRTSISLDQNHVCLNQLEI